MKCATLVRQSTPDWTEIGKWAAAAVAAVLTFWTAFRSSLKSPQEPEHLPSPNSSGEKSSKVPTITSETDQVIGAFQGLIATFQAENTRLWVKVQELERRDDERERHRIERDREMQMTRDRTELLRRHIMQLRSKLVQAGIDPGEGEGMS